MNNELMHYGVKGMRWGVRHERRKINKKLKKVGPKQALVVSNMNTARMRSKSLNEKWRKATKAGKGSKEWKEYEKSLKEFIKPYRDEYIEAWMKDNHIKQLSNQGRIYVEKHIFN